MALGPKLIDDIFGPKGNTAPAKPAGATLIDDLFGKPFVDDGQNGYDFGTGKTRTQIGTEAVNDASARQRAEEANRSRNQRADDAQRARDEAAADSWADTGRKFLNRITPLLKQSVGGIAQSLVENGGNLPENYALTDDERQSIAGEHAAAVDYLAKRGKIPGQQLAASARADLAANEYNPGDSNTKKYAAMIAESMVQMLPSIGTAIATRNPELGAAAMMPQVYGQQYDESRVAGRKPGTAMADAIFMSASEALGEKIPLGMMMKPGGKFLTNTLKTAGAEGLQEMFTQVLQTGYDKGLLNPDMTWGEAFQQVVDAGIVGAGMGVGMHTIGGVARRRAPTAPGVIEAAEAAPAPVSAEDAASPLPTDLIEQGRKVMAASTATTDANGILASNGAPAVGSRVKINGRTGTVRDAFIDDTDADLGAQAGLHVDLDGGGTMREFFADLKDAGINIEAAGIDPDLIDKAVADMEAGGLPAVTAPAAPALDAMSDTFGGDTAIPTATAAAPRAAGAFDMARYMGKARQAESGGDDGAANTRSSASGRYQFTDGTFARYYRQVYGTDAPAGAKNDPAVQDRLMQAMTAENVAGLKRNGVPVNDATVYAAHHFGLGGALSMSRNTDAAVDPAIVKANPQFRGMTNGEAMAWTARHIGAQGGGAAAAPADRPAPIEEADRSRLIDEARSTAQVEVPAPVDSTLAPMADTTEPVVSPAQSEQAAAPAAPAPLADATPAAAAPPVSTATITETTSGKGIVLAGASDAERAAISQAVPKAKATPNKDGNLVFSAKYRADIEQALSSVTPASTPTAVQGDGTRTAPVQVASAADLDTVAPVIATPTDAQKEAGNYRKGHVQLQGLDITIETPKGGERSGTDPNGKPWSVAMPDHYGYVKRTTGADGDQVDVYVGPNPGSSRAFIVDQVDADTGKFDEHKVMLGYDSQEQALAAYDAAFSDGRSADRRGAVTETTVPAFKKMLADNDWSKPMGATDGKPGQMIASPTLSGSMSVEQAAAVARAAQLRAQGARVSPENGGDKTSSGISLHNGEASRTRQDAGISNLEGDTASLPISEIRGLSEIRGRRGDNLSAVGERSGGVPEPYRQSSDTGSFRGQDRRDEGVRAGQRPVGDARGAEQQQAAVAASDRTRQDIDGVPMVDRNRNPRSDLAGQNEQGPSSGTGSVRGEVSRRNGAPEADLPRADNGADGLGQGNRSSAEDAEGTPSEGRSIGASAAARRAVDAKNPNPWVRAGERYTFAKQIDYVGGDPTAVYEIEGKPGKRSAYFRNTGTGGGSSLNNYEIERGLKDGTIQRVDAPAPASNKEASNAGTTEQAVPAAASPASSTYGTSNKLVSTDRAAVLREKLRAKMNQINSGIDPEVLALGAELAVFHIEAGARKFADFSSRMVADIGESVRPYLRSFYESARYYPGMDAIARDMSTPAQIEEEGRGDQGAVRPSDAGAGAENVQRAAQDGGARRAPEQQGEGSGRDVPADERGRTDATERAAEGSQPAAGDRAAGTRNADRVPARDDAGRGRGERAADRDAKRVTGENWRIEPGALDEARSAATKARDNVRAIEIVRELDRSGQPATREQQAALAKYVGWGGLKNAFNETNGTFPKGFEEIGPRVRELLSEEDYDTARRSIQYAHYTSEKIIRPMWEAAQRMGFTGGKVFEPGMGTGNFLGMMPAEIAARTQYQGIEFDGITARIAELLYPQSGIRQADFTRGAIPKDTFDLVIGNPPFSQTVVKSDPEYGKLGFVLHDFFFAKSLDAVRPGGLLMFVTSAGTMNKVGTEARAWMADRADLVGAVRLPGGAFRENAGTDVTTDIVVLRKRAPGDAPGSRAWVDTTELTLPTRSGNTAPVEVNSYFASHPEQILGEHGLFDILAAGERYGVRMREGANMTADLTAALDRVAEGTRIEQRDAATETAAEFDMDSTERKEGSFYVGKDGRLMQHRNGLGAPVEGRGKGVKGGIPAADQERIKALVPIRDALRTVLSHDMANRTAQAAEARTALNSVYDRFVQQFGPINKAEIRYQRPSVIEQESARAAAREEVRLMGGFFNEGSFTPADPNAKLAEIAAARREAREAAAATGREFDEGDFDPAELPDKVIVKRPNVDAFMDDQEGYRLRSIEHYDDDTGEAKKGAIFYQNVVSQERAPQINSTGDALLYVLNRTGRPDIMEIATRAGVSRDQALEELAGKVFKMPGQGETYQTREQYLSGNVRQKLAVAQAAAARDAEFRANVAALEAVQPRPLGPSDIAASLGMPWIPEAVVKEFAETLGLNNVAIRYRPKLAQWSAHGNAYGAAATSEWGTGRRDAIALLGDILNRQTPVIYDTFRTEQGEQRVRNDVETQAAQDKMRAIAGRFKDWVWEDAKRATDLVSLYNENYNNLVAPTYDGGYLTTPGIAEGWSWRPHQQRVVSRIIQSGNTYMAHAVGAGKTSAMIGAGMEMRRLGLVRKPMYVVPNHMLGQFTKEFYEQYPTAKIMVADERQFHTDRRKQFVANVGTSDLDAVIITHSAFGFIPISEQFNEKLLRQQIADFRDILTELKAERSGDPAQRITQRNIEQQIESMEQRIRGRKKRSDQVFTFEETGIDFLFVDEAHLFRKLDFATKMSNVRGVDPSGSGMSYDLFAKTRYLEEQTPGRSHVLASGTPVTNTMAELFSVQRYLQPQELAARALGQFDAWAGAFGETVTQLEQDPAGGYKPVTRFAKFVNVPELSAMVRQVMDVVTSRELEQYVVRPKLLGGSRQMRVSEPTPALDAYQQSLAARMRAIEQRSGKPKKGDDILLSVIGDGRKAAIDMRLVNPAIRETGKSKLEDLIDNVSRISKETENHPFYKAEANGYAAEPFMRGRATQMIFSDLGINGDFQVHRYMRQQLIARGLKDSEVAIISDYKTSVARQRLFNDMNEGKVRVLIGSVPKMGTGVNAQKRLFAIHNLDPQWYPANDEQRNGRGLRQGNMNRELGIYDYSTKATYDSTMWGLMETKARFIEGFFNGDPTMRSMDDLGEASQYEQAKALTTTDPRIMELTQDKQDLERAMLRKAGFERDLYAVRERIASAERGIERMTAAIPQREADLAQRQDLSGDNFTATVMGKTFTDRTEFGEAVLDRLNQLAEGGLTVRDKAVAEISGFKLTADVTRYGREGADATLYFNRNGDVQERIRTETPAGIAASAAAVMRGFESDVAAAKTGIESYKREIAEYTPQTTKMFTGQAEIDALEKRVADMEAVLTKEAAARAAAPRGPIAAPEGAKLSTINPEAATDAYADEYLGSDLEALRAKLATQARKMGMSGDRLVISTVNRLLNDERVAGMYFDGVITVAVDARTAPERTLDHEFIHALKDMGLFRGAEWTVLARDAAADTRLMQRIADRYPALSRDARVEEAVAEMFADWKGERTGFRGAALGRIKDFIDTIRRLIRGVDTSGDVMRRIAAGRVGSREAAAPGGGEAQMSILGSGAVNPNPQTVSEATERAQTFMARLGEGYENWRIAMQDRMLPVQRAEAAVERVIGRQLEDSERPYLAEELMSGRVGAKMGRMTEEHIEPLQAAMLAEKISVDELESFLYAKHAPERNAYIASVNTAFAQGEGSGMTDIEAAAILARIDRAGRTREFERVADRVYALLQFARDERADAGLLSAEQLDSWNSAYKFYVPLRGFAELDNGESRPSTGGQGITVRGAESKKAFGRRSKADDILAHSIMQAEEAIVRGEKNRVARAFYDLAKASPDKDFWQTNKVSMERRMNSLTGLVEDYVVTNLLARDADMTVSLKIDGKERRVTLNEKNPEARKVAEAMRRLDEQGSTSHFVSLLSKYNRFQSTVNTSLNPEFVITNAFRDLQTAGVNLAGLNIDGLQRGTLRDWRKAMVAATKGAFGKGTGEWERWWREFTDEGGRVSYNQMQDVAAITRDFERRFDPARRPNPSGLNTAPKQAAMIAWADIKAAYGFIDKLNTGVENAIRLSAYKNARELGVSAPQAASIAKNLTVNFNRRGSWGVQMNALYLFYNASIQGTARMLMATRNRKVQKIVAGIVVAGVLQELLNMMIGPDDDDGEPVYDKIPEFEKSRNMILMVSGPWGAYLKLPMPWGYNAFHSLGRNIVRAARGERAATVAADTASVFFDAFNPIGNGSLLNLISPTFADPAVDLIQNRDFADRPIMPDQPQYGQPVPDNQRYWGSVNPVWKAVTDTLNTASGGDKVVPGAVDVSPETLEYLFALGTGAAGAFVDRTGGAALKLADGDADSVLGVNDVPMVRKLVGSKPEWRDKAAFYARLGEIEGKIDNAKEYGKSGDQAAVRAYVEKERPSVGLMPIATAARAGMRDIRQAKGAIELAKDRGKIDAATYREKKKRIADAEKRVITGFNAAYLKAIDQPLRP